jgi:hypothetical protein
VWSRGSSPAAGRTDKVKMKVESSENNVRDAFFFFFFSCFSGKMLVLRHAFFRAEVGVVDGRVLVGVFLLASQLGVVQAAGVAEGAGAIGPTSPLGCLGAVATVAASGWCSATPAFLGIGTSESTLHVVLMLHRGHDRLGVCLLLLALLGGLLVVGNLLCHNDFADFGEAVDLQTSFADHVFDFHDAGKRGWRWT